MAIGQRNHGIWVSSFLPLGYKFLNSLFIFFLYFLLQSALYPIHQRNTLQHSLSPKFKMDSTPNLEFANIQLALTLLFNFYQEFRRYREEARRYQIRQLQYRYALRHLALEIAARFVYHFLLL